MKLFSRSRSATRHTIFFRVREAMDREGCPVCRLSLDSVADYLDGTAYESVNDPGLRNHLRSSRGFCPHHAWQFLGVHGGQFSVAMIYADVLSEVKRILELGGRQLSRPGGSSLGGQGLAARLAPELPCPACLNLAESQHRYLGALIEHLPEQDFATAYRSSRGLCLPHLELAISWPHLPSTQVQRALIETALHALEGVETAPDANTSDAGPLSVDLLSGAHGALMECRQRPQSWTVPSPDESRLGGNRRGRPPGGEHCPLCEDAMSMDDGLVAQLLSGDEPSLCNLHLRRILKTARPDAVSRLIEAERSRLVGVLRDHSQHPSRSRGLLHQLQEAVRERLAIRPAMGSKVCCEVSSLQVQRQLDQVALQTDSLGGSGARDTAAEPSSLCFTHLLVVLAGTSHADASILAIMEAAGLQDLVEELKEFVRKHDYRFSAEPWGEEASSPWRTLRKMAGAERAWGVGGLWAPGERGR